MSTPSRHGPITRRVIEALRQQMRMKVVDLAAFRAGQEYAEALQQSVTSKEQLAKSDPAHAAYVYAQHQMSIMAEQLLQGSGALAAAQTSDSAGPDDGFLSQSKVPELFQ